MRRAVITGIGAVTPLGNTMSASFQSVIDGRSAIAPITRFDASSLPWKYAAELAGFQSPAPSKDALHFDPFVLYAHAAALEAVSASGAKLDNAGLVIGSGRGGITMMEAAVRKARPGAYTMAGTTVSMAASYIARSLGIHGPLAGISTACASGSVAIGEALWMIRSGRVDVAIAGGAEAPLCALAQQGYGTAGALSKSGRIRPFSASRDGFVLGEGAAVMVIEEREHAIKRGATIYAELSGYANITDCTHPTASGPEGQARAIRSAIEDAGLGTDDVGLVIAHATGTRMGDASEAEALSSVFGRSMPRIAAIKPCTGHMLAASGAFETAMTAMALRTRTLPPSLHGEGLEYKLAPARRKGEPLAALCQSFGFGGVNAVLALRACVEP